MQRRALLQNMHMDLHVVMYVLWPPLLQRSSALTFWQANMNKMVMAVRAARWIRTSRKERISGIHVGAVSKVPECRVFARYYCIESSSGESQKGKESKKPGEFHSTKKNAGESSGKTSRQRDVEDEKRRVLDASLVHVPKIGWTEAAIAAGARDVNLSPAILGAFPRKEAALVEYFMEESLEDLIDKVEEQRAELEKLVLHERLARIIRIRLEFQAPYIQKWAQALSIQANPINLPVALKQRAVLIDEIWHAVGDRSTDWDWYTKRAILGGVYTAAEVYMLTDYSPGFRDTWKFLQQRVNDAVDCRKTANEATQLVQAIGTGLGNTIAAFLKQPRSGF